uniref:CobN/magnesium chelatase domain-containing protein n=1 Tax=Lotharella oceanica TaxID=641309 RepID=A0A7S2XH80_9EUKA
MDSALALLDGGYVEPGVGGDLIRDGAGVLPTGRNIHSLDPYRMPSPAAWERAKSIAAQILDQHLQSTGEFPETVAVTMWGLDAIKTRGESVGVALALVGAEPVKEATGRIVKYQLMPLEKLGRPRVDVVCSMSGIFRDSFANVVDLLDDLFEQASLANEPMEMNYIKKHTQDLQEEGSIG